MLMPRRVKRRKQHRGRMKGKALRGNKVTYGQFGLQAMEPAWITGNQIEAARIAINRYFRRGGTVWIKIFPDKPVSKKPAETRMGKGKGSPEYWVAVVKPGRVLFEVAGVTEKQAREALRLASHKLPCKVRFVESERKFTEEEIAKFAEVQVLDIPDELLTDEELAEQAAETEVAEDQPETSDDASAEADAE
ncbi:MAG: 50S ribosomal protein L16 [Clostridiaceae bacterium]|jgi:large subunit ribosomal protein L16|nr:50S ribosomal protein L16 [Clostridiaceae bacterium]